jgi:hypothetical protein
VNLKGLARKRLWYLSDGTEENHNKHQNCRPSLDSNREPLEYKPKALPFELACSVRDGLGVLFIQRRENGLVDGNELSAWKLSLVAFFVFSGPPLTVTVNMHIKSMGSVSETDQVCTVKHA